MSGYSQSVEDYLEALYRINLDQKVVRVKNVANFLGVSMPSVVAAVRTLSEKGLVHQEKYGHIELTSKGEEVAREIYNRHQMLLRFFNEILGLDLEKAEEDACRVEHQLSQEAGERLMKMMEFVHTCSRERVKFLERYHNFLETGDTTPCNGCSGSR